METGSFKNFQQTYVRPIKNSVEMLKLFGSDHFQRNRKNSQISAKGIELLQYLHKQILPFILRREKSQVLQDLPPKTIVDIVCPLSIHQRKLYSQVLGKYQCNEADLLNSARSHKAVESQMPEIESSSSSTTQEEIDDFNISEQLYESLVSQPNKSANRGIFNFQLLPAQSSQQNPNTEMFQALKPNPLQLLSFLQFICLHPCLVISEDKHSSYYEKLSDEIEASGKFLQLLKLLVEINVMNEEDFVLNSRNSFDTFAALQSKIFQIDEEFEEIVTATDEKIPHEIDGEREDPPDASSDEDELEINNEENVNERTRKGFPRPSSISRKCLIFAKHMKTLDLVEELIFEKFFPNVGRRRLDGSIPPRERFEIAKSFNSRVNETCDKCEQGILDMPSFPSVVTQNQDSENDENIRVLLLTTRSCGLGLNLSSADTVIFLEHDWNPFVDIQAMDRVHRLGQKNPVSVYRLLADAPIENRILSFQDLKSTLANEVSFCLP